MTEEERERLIYLRGIATEPRDYTTNAFVDWLAEAATLAIRADEDLTEARAKIDRLCDLATRLDKELAEAKAANLSPET